MENRKKRERQSNFTNEETEKLVALASEMILVIENKKSDAATWHEKEAAWQAIENEFNSSGPGSGTYRSAKNLRLKYDSLKSNTKRKCNAIAECFRTGGDTTAAPILSPVELKMKEMIMLSVDDCAAETTHRPDASSTSDSDHSDQPDSKDSVFTQKWPVSTWKHKNLLPKTQPVVYETPTKSTLDKLAEAKMELANIQKKIAEEELNEKYHKTELLRIEIQHKKEMFQLEKEQMILKKDILNIELDSLKKKIYPK